MRAPALSGVWRSGAEEKGSHAGVKIGSTINTRKDAEGAIAVGRARHLQPRATRPSGRARPGASAVLQDKADHERNKEVLIGDRDRLDEAARRSTMFSKSHGSDSSLPRATHYNLLRRCIPRVPRSSSLMPCPCGTGPAFPSCIQANYYLNLLLSRLISCHTPLFTPLFHLYFYRILSYFRVI